MLMVGGAAVNFHGYQRFSSDIDFWIDTSKSNFNSLIKTLNDMGYVIKEFPEDVLKKKKNISLKLSEDLNLELITNFSAKINFDEAWKKGVNAMLLDENSATYKVISLEDLILSKMLAGRPKDILDVQELQNIQKNK